MRGRSGRTDGEARQPFVSLASYCVNRWLVASVCMCAHCACAHQWVGRVCGCMRACVHQWVGRVRGCMRASACLSISATLLNALLRSLS